MAPVASMHLLTITRSLKRNGQPNWRCDYLLITNQSFSLLIRNFSIMDFEKIIKHFLMFVFDILHMGVKVLDGYSDKRIIKIYDGICMC